MTLDVYLCDYGNCTRRWVHLYLPTVKELGTLGVALFHFFTFVRGCFHVADRCGKNGRPWLHQHLAEVDAVTWSCTVQRGPVKTTTLKGTLQGRKKGNLMIYYVTVIAIKIFCRSKAESAELLVALTRLIKFCMTGRVCDFTAKKKQKKTVSIADIQNYQTAVPLLLASFTNRFTHRWVWSSFISQYWAHEFPLLLGLSPLFDIILS